MTRTALAVLLAAAVSAAPALADEAKEVVIKTTRLAPNVAMLEGQGGNMGVLFDEHGALLIDDEFAPLTAKIKAAVAELTKNPIRFVANTHWHGDHTGGNENLGRDGAVIVAHDNVRKRMSVEQFNKVFNRATPASPAIALPVITFAEQATVHFAGEDLEAVHAAHGHTDGDAVMHFKKANVIHCGDLFFNGGYPFIDLDSGGSIDGYIAAQEKILGMADDQTKLIPGHGPLGDKAALKAANDVLKELRGRIHKALAEGKTVEQIVAARPSADHDEKWGKGFVKGELITKTIATSLSK
jgi:glyoxylase-like metal-dependent hydrolase (beta-lactamase superfamily II)